MRRLMISMMLVLFVVVMGCSKTQVMTDFDPSRDFATFKTYSWMKLELGQVYDTQGDLHEHILQAIDAQMAAEGFTKVDDNPDVVVMYHGHKTPKIKLGDAQYQYKYPTAGTMPYDQGTLVVELIDPDTNKIVWRGVSEGMMPEDARKKDAKEFVDKGVKDLFEKYPPK